MKRNLVTIIISIIFSCLLLNIPFTNAQSPISILSSSYYEQFGYSFVVGEIKNTGSNNLENIIITVNYYDDNDTKLASGFTYSKIQVLKPEQISPFEVSSIPYNDLNVDHYDIEISNYFVSSFVPYREFTFENVTSVIEDNFMIQGEVYNNGSTDASWVRVIATYYDSSSNVMGTDTSYANPDTVNPGESAPFILDTFPREYIPDSYFLQVECRESALTSSSLSISLSDTSLIYGDSITTYGVTSPEIEGAEILLKYSKPDGSNTNRIATTDSSGKYTYTLTPDKTGAWSVIASWEGNENYTGSSSTTKGFSVSKKPVNIPIAVTPNELLQNESVSIYGFILPLVQNAELSLNITKPDGYSYSATTITNSGGIFNYSFSPFEPGYWSVSIYYAGDQRYNSATSETIFFHVTKVEHFGNLSFLLNGQNNTPISGVTVASMTQPLGQNTLNGTTGVDGTRNFADVYAGEYIFEISKTDYETQYKSVTVTEGETTNLVVYLGSIFGDISLIVNDQDGEPVNGVFVESVSQPFGQGVINGSTDMNGSISFNSVIVGNYSFKFSKIGYELAYSLVEVSEGETDSLIIPIETLYGELNIVVRDQEGTYLKGVFVELLLQPDGQHSLNGISGVDGNIVFNNLAIGNYSISFNKTGYETIYEYVIVEENDGSSLSVVLEILFGDISLIVNNQDGEPVNGVIVESISQPIGQDQIEGITGINGAITFTNVLPGEYTVKLVNDDYLEREETFIVNPKGVHSFSLNLVQIEQYGNLKVVVKDEENNLLSDILVVSTEYPNEQKLLNGTTDSEGLIIFSNVKLGEYILVISVEGFEQIIVIEDVLPDLTTDVDVTLIRVRNDLFLYVSVISILLLGSVLYLKREVISSYLSKKS